MKTTTLKRTGNLIATILFLILTIGMLQGNIQTIIPFANELNEIGFTILSLLLTSIFAVFTVTE